MLSFALKRRYDNKYIFLSTHPRSAFSQTLVYVFLFLICCKCSAYFNKFQVRSI